MRPRASILALLSLLTGCAGAAPAPQPVAHPATTTIARVSMPEGAPREELAWATFSPETFARAKAEHKFLVLDGSAEWCHWCHVMEATTYHDPAVRKLLDEHFIAVKVDVDSRPDVEERYGDYGWPATVMFSPDATELGKYRGYIEPEKFKGILEEIVASGIAEKKNEASAKASAKVPRTALGEETLAWVEREIAVQLEDYYDDEQGSW